MSANRVTVGRAGAMAVAALALGGVGFGCAPKQRPTLSKPPEVNPQPAVEMDLDKRVAELKRQADELAGLAKRLPGATADENRQMIREVFVRLAQALPQLGGPNAGGVFEHQISVVTDTRTQLTSRSADLAVEPIVDNGLRAARTALGEAAHATYYQEPQVGQGLDQLAAKIESLDTYQGAAHWQAVAVVVQQESAIVSQMAGILATRLADTASHGTATAPAAPSSPGSPVTTPATGPAETK